MERLLTMGSLKSLMNNKEVHNPVVQILGIQKINTVEMKERYRLHISDGQNVNSFIMLMSQLNGIISSGGLTEFAIVRIKRYIIGNLSDCSKKKGNKQVMIIIDLDILIPGNNVGLIVGDPIPIIDSSDQVIGNGLFTSLDTSKPHSNSMILHSAQASVIDNPIDPQELYQDGLVKHYAVTPQR